jgi:hypothetical protein
MTPNKYAELATQAARMAAQVRPAENDPYAEALNLTVYHLNSAATKLRKIAEHQVQRGAAANAAAE